MADNYRIGEVVKKLHINKETIRYYERIGLISRPQKEQNGYRLYSEADINIIYLKLKRKKSRKLLRLLIKE